MVARYALFRVFLIFRSALELLPFTSWLLADWDEHLPQNYFELAAGVKSWKWHTGLGMGWGTFWSDFDVVGWVEGNVCGGAEVHVLPGCVVRSRERWCIPLVYLECSGLFART